MQLDLFNDNRPGILLNMADEYLRGTDFEKAVIVCRQVCQEYPANHHAPELLALLQTWHTLLYGIEPPSSTPHTLYEVYCRLASVSNATLRTTVLKRLLSALERFPEPDHIFIAPDFHRGHLLLRLGNHETAISAFRNALASPALPQGKFLAWTADAMTMAGMGEDAVSIYLRAFLEDPASVDGNGIKNKKIRDLRVHCAQHADGIDDDGELPWLPVWGWFQNVFAIPLQQPPDFDALQTSFEEESLPVPRLWFDLLTRAEYLRTVKRDDKELPIVRRMMKQLHQEMFDCYITRIKRTEA